MEIIWKLAELFKEIEYKHAHKVSGALDIIELFECPPNIFIPQSDSIAARKFATMIVQKFPNK